MSRLTVVAKDGLVRVTNDDLDFDNLHELVRDWNFAQSAADEDWDARRVDHLERTSAVATSAADDVRDAAGFALTWQDALEFAAQIELHAMHLRRQEQNTEARERLGIGAQCDSTCTTDCGHCKGKTA